MTLFASSVALVYDGPFYIAALAGQLLLYGLAVYGAARDRSAASRRPASAVQRWSSPRVQQGAQ
jgi:hypothetical protein